MATAADSVDDVTPARAVAGRMADAAQAWLDTLDAGQRRVAAGIAPTANEASDAERRRWFYTPTDHGGLTLHQQRPAQQRAAMRLVASGLSTAGFGTVATVLGLENVLDHTEGFVKRFGRERGRDPGLYYLRVFGEPGAAAWGWRFGGHHVSLNNLVVDGAVVAVTPCFLGADPATSPLLGGAVLRPLARVEDLARELVRTLRPELAARAVLLPRAPWDLVTTNRTRVFGGEPPGGIWREEVSADPVVHAKPESRAGDRPRHRAARDPARAARHLLRPRPRSCLPDRSLRRRGRPGRRSLRLGRAHRARRPALLPPARPTAADRVGQHPARGQPRALGVARPDGRLRAGRARGAPRHPPLTRPSAASRSAPASTGPLTTV